MVSIVKGRCSPTEANNSLWQTITSVFPCFFTYFFHSVNHDDKWLVYIIDLSDYTVYSSTGRQVDEDLMGCFCAGDEVLSSCIDGHHCCGRFWWRPRGETDQGLVFGVRFFWVLDLLSNPRLSIEETGFSRSTSTCSSMVPWVLLLAIGRHLGRKHPKAIVTVNDRAAQAKSLLIKLGLVSMKQRWCHQQQKLN